MNEFRCWRYSDRRLSREQVSCSSILFRGKTSGRVRMSTCQGWLFSLTYASKVCFISVFSILRLQQCVFKSVFSKVRLHYSGGEPDFAPPPSTIALLIMIFDFVRNLNKSRENKILEFRRTEYSQTFDDLIYIVIAVGSIHFKKHKNKNKPQDTKKSIYIEH